MLRRRKACDEQPYKVKISVPLIICITMQCNIQQSLDIGIMAHADVHISKSSILFILMDGNISDQELFDQEIFQHRK